MASTVSFSGTAAWKRLCHKPSAKPKIVPLPIKTCHFGQNRVETHQNAIPRERNIKNKTQGVYPVLASKRGSVASSSPASPSETVKEFYACINDGQLKRLRKYISADCFIEECSFSTPFKGGSVASSSPASPSETVKEFYACINDGQLKRLRKYISADCFIEECSFSTPFKGKEEVLSFLDQLIMGMGRNVKFRVKQVCEADGLIAAANWHLEWKEAEIPFTRGCSFFECSKEGEKLVIKKAQIVIESPVKPGRLVLVLLKIVTKLFDDFPKTTEWFLKSPHAILHRFQKIYSILFAIFISPVVKSYLHIWNLTIRVYSYAFHIFLYILNMFIK